MDTENKSGWSGGLIIALVVLFFIAYGAYRYYKETSPPKPLTTEQKLLAEQEARWGEKPFQSDLTGSVPEIEAYLKGILNDPDSLKFSAWGKLRYDENLGWLVWADFRAKNGFGGYVREKMIFSIMHGQVVAAQDFDEFMREIRGGK